MSALKYWIWLTTRKGMDSAAVLRVLEHFATPEQAYYADERNYEHLPLSPAARLGLKDKSMEKADMILADCERLGVRIMTCQDADYPERLRQIPDPPAVLYIKGRVFHFDEEVAIGVVGAREPSDYGRRMAEKLGLELAAGGALVVSGIAPGLDSCALKGALKAGGPVVSVLAGGVDVPYPYENRFLYQDVAASGALISEYPPGTEHKGHHFPRRNRILSGLTLGVLAVECRSFGGTMLTVNHALEQDRDLFAIPGPVDAPMSEGPNRLIQQGAKLVTCGRDILEEYESRYPWKLAEGRDLPLDVEAERLKEPAEESKPEQKTEKVEPAIKRPVVSRAEQMERFTDDERMILFTLGKQTQSAEQLVEQTQIPTRRVLSALTMLQVQGAVEEQPGRRFAALVALEE